VLKLTDAKEWKGRALKCLDDLNKKILLRFNGINYRADLWVNGKFVFIKSGGWTDDVLLHDTKESVEAQLKYVRHMNMNDIRCEGFWGKDEEIYDQLIKNTGSSISEGISLQHLTVIAKSCHADMENLQMSKSSHSNHRSVITK
jgi:hypothetical protein